MYWTVVFLLVAAVSALLGVAGLSVEMAQWLTSIFLGLSAIAAMIEVTRSRR